MCGSKDHGVHMLLMLVAAIADGMVGTAREPPEWDFAKQLGYSTSGKSRCKNVSFSQVLVHWAPAETSRGMHVRIICTCVWLLTPNVRMLMQLVLVNLTQNELVGTLPELWSECPSVSPCPMTVCLLMVVNKHMSAKANTRCWMWAKYCCKWPTWYQQQGLHYWCVILPQSCTSWHRITLIGHLLLLWLPYGELQIWCCKWGTCNKVMSRVDSARY